MKKLLLVLLLAAGMAHAEVIAKMPNKAGGFLYLTDVSTKGCSANSKAMFANSSDGKSIWGCWFLDDVVIHVRWDDGGTSAFPVEAFTLVKKSKGTDL